MGSDDALPPAAVVVVGAGTLFDVPLLMAAMLLPAPVHAGFVGEARGCSWDIDELQSKMFEGLDALHYYTCQAIP